MTRFNAQQIQQFLDTPQPATRPAEANADFFTQNEEHIMQALHTANTHRRHAWIATAAAVMLLLVGGLTAHLLPRHAESAADDTLHALYDTDEQTPDDEINTQEDLLESDIYLQIV